MSHRKFLSGTDLIHGDAAVRDIGPNVAPSISVSTTFRATNTTSEDIHSLADIDPRNPQRHVYSRYTQPVTTRAEHILSQITVRLPNSVLWPGLAASYAALVFYQPKRVAITGGYFGSHKTLEVYKKTKGSNLEIIGIDDEFQLGDLCWLETPLNPTGEVRDIRYYADKIHKVGGKLFVDSTFAPPPLQYPFKFGADCIIHSGTKYIGGHSDMLCGILVVNALEEWNTLQQDRTYLGSMMGSLESWLLLRSLRTLHLRIPRQSTTATTLVRWLKSVASTPEGSSYDGVPGGVLVHVWHSSLQGRDSRGFDPSEQMEGGWNATFAILLSRPEYARQFPNMLKNFMAATSLGGVDSLAEYRLHSDPDADPRLVRISIGVEEVEDLKADIRQALQKVTKLNAKM